MAKVFPRDEKSYGHFIDGKFSMFLYGTFVLKLMGQKFTYFLLGHFVIFRAQNELTRPWHWMVN